MRGLSVIALLSARSLIALMAAGTLSCSALAQEQSNQRHGFAFNGFELGVDYVDAQERFDQERFDSECSEDAESKVLLCDETVIAEGVQMAATFAFNNATLTRISVDFPADKYNSVLRSIKARYGNFSHAKKGELVWVKKPRGDITSPPDELHLYKRAPIAPAPDPEGVKYLNGVYYSSILFESKAADQRASLGNKLETLKSSKRLKDLF